MDPAALFEENLALIDRAIAGVCRRVRMAGADAEDFASAAKLALMENDYAVLRRFEGRCSLSTFLVIVIRRLLADEMTRRLGKWHPSREAERFGDVGVKLEAIVRRDGRSIDEALPILQAIDPTLTRPRVQEMVERLPQRAPRPRAVDPDDAGTPLMARERADDRLVSAEADRVSGRTESVVRQELSRMSLEDRAILRFHFGSSLTIKQISEVLRLPQRPLYRRLEALLARLRNALRAAGIDAPDVRALIGSAGREMNLGLQGQETVPGRRTNGSELPVQEAG